MNLHSIFVKADAFIAVLSSNHLFTFRNISKIINLNLAMITTGDLELWKKSLHLNCFAAAVYCIEYFLKLLVSYLLLSMRKLRDVSVPTSFLNQYNYAKHKFLYSFPELPK